MIQIDQSNKIERTAKDTVLAMCNQYKRTILIPAGIKREAISSLRNKGRGRNIAYYHLFAAGLFILLLPYLPAIIQNGETIAIDTEYTGHDDKIKGVFLEYARQHGLNLPKDQIYFTQIGKKAAAHKMAWAVQRGQMRADHVVTLGELLPLL